MPPVFYKIRHPVTGKFLARARGEWSDNGKAFVSAAGAANAAAQFWSRAGAWAFGVWNGELEIVRYDTRETGVTKLQRSRPY